MNGVHRFLSRRDRKSKANVEGPYSVTPSREVHRVLQLQDEKRKTDKEGDKKIKEVNARLHSEDITMRDGQVEDVLRLPSVDGDVEKAVSLLRLFNDAAENRLRVPNLDTKLAGAENRSNVTCYLDSLLFSMFARTDSFEGIISADFPDEPRKRLATLLRLWVNMLRTGTLITTDITTKLQESLRDCGWPEAALLRQQDVSEAFSFITGKLDLPLLTLKMDVYHTGKEDRDDHRIVQERLLDVAIPEPPKDGTVIRLEDCLEQYFNNKIEVKRHLQRRNTIPTVRPQDHEEKRGMITETVELVDDRPAQENGTIGLFNAKRKRGQSIFGERQSPSTEGRNEERRAHDDIGLRGNRERAATMRREVLMPAWQFFSLIPWYNQDHLKVPKNDQEVVVHLEKKRPVLGICLKRYSMTNAGVGSRLDTFIDIPIEIGVPHFISDDCGLEWQVYEPNFTNFKLSLLAVICHRGKSLDAGHYISIVRGREDASGEATQWLRFDDLAQERIVTVDIQKALKDECPYLLFYQVRPIDEESTDDPPTYDEATTDSSLSRVPTQSDPTPFVSDASSTVPSESSHETLTSAEALTPALEACAVSSEDASTMRKLAPVMSEPQAHVTTRDSSSRNEARLKVVSEIRPKSLDLNGLVLPGVKSPKISLDISRVRPSFESTTRNSQEITSSSDTSLQGGTSAPITPGEENRAGWLSRSRRNSITKGWRRSRSRPPSEVGDNRYSINFSNNFNRLKNAISKDMLSPLDHKLSTVDHKISMADHKLTAMDPVPKDDAVGSADRVVVDAATPPTQTEKACAPRRSKSLRRKKGKRSGSISRILESGIGTERKKKTPDRECILM